MHGGGSKSQIRIEHKSNNTEIRISDNGKGIEEKDIPLIFDRLYKCDESRTHKGNGLGLTIVKELVEAHGGVITAESVPNEKTTFTITLPLNKTS